MVKKICDTTHIDNKELAKLSTSNKYKGKLNRMEITKMVLYSFKPP